jgi:hypothetical protein
MCRGRLVALLLLIPGTVSYAVESGEQPMTIVRAEQKARDHVVAWVNDTPIYREDPYFEVVVRAGAKLLQGERDPESAWEMLPVFWKPGVKVQGRVQGHSLFLKRPNGVEMRFVILKRSAAPAEESQ